MLKTYTVRLDLNLVKSIDRFVIHNNTERLKRLEAGDVDYNTLPRRFDSRSDFIEQAICEYLMRHDRGAS